MTVDATVRLRGAQQIQDSAARARQLLDFGQELVLRDLGDLFRRGEERIFSSRGGAIGKPWAPLKESTQKARARLNRKFGLGISPSRPMLVLFGDLRDSLTTLGGAQTQRIHGDRMQIVVDTTAINRHNRKKGLGMTLTKRGTRRKPRGKGAAAYPEDAIALHDEGQGRIPRRKILGVPDATQDAMNARVKSYLDNLVRIAAGGV